MALPPTIYDPARVTFIFGTVPIKDFAPGSFISVSRDEPVWKKVKGTNGELRRIKQNVKSGVVTITLRHTSPFNRLLGVALAVDESHPTIILPITILDSLNGTLVSSIEAYIDRYPDLAYTQTEPNLTWSWTCNELNITYPGFSIESALSRL